MLRSLASPFLYILLFSHASYGLSIATRAIQVAGPLISSPTEGTTIVAGQPFDFQYVVSDACHEGYSPFNVSLLSSQPTGLTSTGTLVDGDDDLLYTFGSFLSPNYGYYFLHSCSLDNFVLISASRSATFTRRLSPSSIHSDGSDPYRS